MFEFLNYIYYFNLYNTLLFVLFGLYNYPNNEFLLNSTYNLIRNSGVVGLKFCQWFIYNIRLVSDNENIDRFDNFYENCKKHSLRDTKAIFKKDFGFDITNYLEFIDTDPIASGSIGQVYKCRLIHNNQEVALKVKHPNMKYQVDYPIFLIKTLSSVIKYFNHKLQIPLNIEQFFKILKDQLDFNIEYNNAKHFQEIFKGNKIIKIPDSILCSENIYVSEYVEGKYFEEIEDLSHYKKSKIALGFLMFNRQSLCINNLMHADLHKGNWKIKCNNDSKDFQFKIIIYDFGFCFQSTKNLVEDIWLSWEIGDEKLMASTFVRLIEDDNKNFDINIIETKILTVINEVLKKPIDFALIIKRILNFMINEKIVLTGNIINFFIIVILMDKIIKNYDLSDNHSSEIDTEDLIENQFKTDYLNYIHFCDYYDSFNELNNYMKRKLKKYSKIDTLFFKIEDKVFSNDNFELVENENNNSNITIEL